MPERVDVADAAKYATPVTAISPGQHLMSSTGPLDYFDVVASGNTRPWNAEATVFAFPYTRIQPKSVLELLARKPVATLCAPPTVWRMLTQVDLRHIG